MSLWMEVDEVAAALDLSRDQLYRWIATGNMPFPIHAIGRRYRVARPDLERFLREGTPQASIDRVALQAALERALTAVLADHNLAPDVRLARKGA